MQLRSQLHHRYCECVQIGGCFTKIAMEIFDSGSIFQKAAICGHPDLPLAPIETLQSYLKEKRHYPSTPVLFYNNLPDL